MKTKAIIIIILIWFLVLSNVSATTYQSTYTRWDGEVRPVSEKGSPFSNYGLYKVTDIGSQWLIQYDEEEFKLNKNKGSKELTWHFDTNKISMEIKDITGSQLLTVVEPHNSTTSYVSISNIVGLSGRQGLRWGRMFWSKNFEIKDNPSRCCDENGSTYTEENYLPKHKAGFKIVNGEIRLYAEKMWFQDAYYPIDIKFNSFTFEGTGIQACWDGIVCDFAVVNSNSSSKGIISQNETIGVSEIGTWFYDELTGTNAIDISGQNNHLDQWTNNPVYVNGFTGSGVSTTIAANADITDGDMAIDANLSYNTRVMLMDTSIGFISKRTPTEGAGNFKVDLSDGAAEMTVWNSGSDSCNLVPSMTEGIWYMVGLAFQSETNDYKLFLNGAKVGNCAITKDLADNAETFTIGFDGQTGYGFKRFDNSRLWNRILSDQEFEDLWNASYPLSGNITTNGLGNANDTVELNIGDQPASTAIDIWSNSTGSWVSVCSGCLNQTNYTFTNSTGGELRVELRTTNRSQTILLDAIIVNSGVVVTPSVTITTPPNDTNTTNTTWHLTALPISPTRGFTNLTAFVSNTTDYTIIQVLNSSKVENNTNMTFEVNLTVDGKYNVYFEVWDNASTPELATSTNITIRRDTTPPENITAQQPANTTHGVAVYFNITGVDALTLINAAWYSLDGADNRSLTNSTGNWNDVNNSMTNGPHYVDFYMNDSLGNENTTIPRRWFIVDAEGPPATINSPLNTSFLGNASGFDILLNATFGEIVNWTWYSVDGGPNLSYVEGVTNLTVLKIFLVAGGHNISVYANDSFNNLAIETTFFTIRTAPFECTDNPSQLETLILNLTDEENYGAQVNGTIGVQLTITDSLTNTAFNYGFLNSSTDSMSICIGNSSIGDSLNADITYHSLETFQVRFWYLRNYIIPSTTRNITLALLNVSLSADPIFTVFDEEGNTAENYIISLQRFIFSENAFITMTMALTNNIGEALLRLRPNDQYYVFVVSDPNGVAIKQFDPQVITQTTNNLRLDPTIRGYYFETLGTLSHSCVYTNSTLTLTCTASEAQGIMTRARLMVYQLGALNWTLVGNVSAVGSTVSIPFTVSNGSREYYFEFLIGFDASTIRTVESGYFSSSPMQDLYGETGILAAAFLIVGAAFISLHNPVVSLGFLFLGIVISRLMGLFSTTSSSYIMVVGAIIVVSMWRLRKKR